MALKTVVELGDSKLLAMMKSSIFVAEFPFLKVAYEKSQQIVAATIPPNCTPCKRKRLLQQAASGSKIDFDGVRQQISGMAPAQLLRLKTLLQARTVRVPNITKNGRKTALQF